MNYELKGTILKGIGGFYYVESDDSNIYECKARGLFRNKGIIPFVGDKVIFTLKENGFHSINNIIKRKNCLVRPPISNIDNMFIVAATIDPNPNLLLIDKMLTIAYHENIRPILVVSKTDLFDASYICEVYKNTGIKVIQFSKFKNDGINEIKALTKNNTSVFVGNSGVGKSTILNSLSSKFSLKTGETSKKLGRGKHTTRKVEIFKIGKTSYIADTPGFSAIDFRSYRGIEKNELAGCFLEFNKYLNKCKFSSCTHICEKGCKIIDAVEKGKINKLRHKNYTLIYNELNSVNKWKNKK